MTSPQDLNLKQSVQNQFGAAAQRYASSWPHRAGQDLEAMLEACPPEVGQKILDVGSGAGHTAFAFASAAGAATVDATEAAVLRGGA